MALFQDSTVVRRVTNPEFDPVYKPGDQTPFSGIYRCLGCGHEVVSEHSRPFPPQNHPQHTPSQGSIRWKLVVYAEHKQ